MRKLVLIILSLSFLIISFQSPQTATAPNLVGVYSTIDTNKKDWFCKFHSLTLKKDSTFEYYSPCLNSEGRWKYKNKKIILNSKIVLYGWSTGEWDQDKDYDAANNNLRVRILGYNKKPIVCEEIKCFYEGKSYTQFTDKEGCVYFPVEKFDTICHISIGECYREAWKKYPENFVGKVSPTRLPPSHWFGMNASFTAYYTVNNEYQHYCHFKNMEFAINKEGQLIANTAKQDSVIIKAVPDVPFAKKIKK